MPAACLAGYGRNATQYTAIEAPRHLLETAPQTVKFLLATHALHRVLPHTIPRDTPNDPKKIALLSFSMFGKLACFATYDDIRNVEIPPATSQP